MLVSGYSGVGKTALVAALHEPVLARRGYFLRGKCDQYRRNRPYAALSDAFRALMQQLAVEGRDAYWQAKLGAALGEHAGAVIDLVPELQRHLALHEERLAQYQRFEARDFPAGKPLTRGQAIQHMILKKGMLYEQGEIAWGREMVALLSAPTDA